MKKVKVVIDNPTRRKKFIRSISKFFGDELKQESVRIMSKECDLIEFAFKDNGFVRINKEHLKDV